MKKRKKSKLQSEVLQNNVASEDKINEIQITSFEDLKNIFKQNIIFFVIIAVLIFFAYSQVLNGEFVNADDILGIVENPTFKNLSKSLRTLHLHTIFHALVINLIGMNSTVFHVSSVIFHIINTVLVFFLTFLLFGKKPAIITSALFSVHPLNSEAVSWISANSYLFIDMFTLLTLIFYFLYRRSDNRKYYIISFTIYTVFLATYQAPFSLTAPFILVLLDQFVIEKKINLKRIAFYIPYIVSSIAFVLYVLFVQGLYQTRVADLETQYYVNQETAIPWKFRLPYIIHKIFELLIYPKYLTIYNDGNMISDNMFRFMILTTSIVIVGIFYLWYKNKRVYSGLLLSILFTTLPSFSPIIIAWFIADRYLYPAVIFYLMIVSLLLVALEKKLKSDTASKYIVFILILLYFSKTFVRAGEWKNSKALWIATEKTSPLSYRVYNNLGDVYSNEGNYELAMQNFAKSIQLKPDYAEAYHNIGYNLALLNRNDEARKFLFKALELKPSLFQSHYIIGVLYFNENRLNEAEFHFQKAVDINPQDIYTQQALTKVKQQRSGVVTQTTAPAAQQP